MILLFVPAILFVVLILVYSANPKLRVSTHFPYVSWQFYAMGLRIVFPPGDHFFHHVEAWKQYISRIKTVQCRTAVIHNKLTDNQYPSGTFIEPNWAVAKLTQLG